MELPADDQNVIKFLGATPSSYLEDPRFSLQRLWNTDVDLHVTIPLSLLSDKETCYLVSTIDYSGT